MQDKDTTIIGRKKGKAIFLVIACLPFTAIGLMMLADAVGTIVESGPVYDQLKQAGIALASLLLFGSGFALGTRMLIDRRPALTLSSAGIHDGSDGTSFGFIPWSDITGIAKFKAGRHETLILEVADPEKYLQSGNTLARLMRWLNHKTVGSPVSINCLLLKVRFDEFAVMVQRYLRRYGGGGNIVGAAASVQGSHDWSVDSPVVKRCRSVD